MLTECGSARTSSPRLIALTHEFFPRRGGIATYTREVALEAHEMGYAVEVWAPAHPRLQEVAIPFAVHPLPVKGTQGWPCRLALSLCLHRQRQDWEGATLYLPEPGPLRAWMYWQLVETARPKRLVITLHGSEINTFTRFPHRRILFQKLLDEADRIGVVSRYSRDLLLETFPDCRPPVVVAPGALRRDCAADPGEARKPPAGGPVVFMTVGRVHPRKGQMAVLEAMALLPEEVRRRVSYRIIGPVSRPSYLRDLRKRAERERVDFAYLGEVEEEALNEVYRGADVFIMASLPHRGSVEGFGLSYLEASAQGLPVIAHRTGGVGDAVRHGETGLKVDPEDRAGLAEAIATLARDPGLRAKLGANGRKWARTFSWRKTAEQLFGPVG